MKIKILVLGLVCLFLISCATAPVPRQIVNTFPIEKPFDLVWQAVIESFADMNLPIANMEKDSGLITTDWVAYPRGKKGDAYCDCGGLGIWMELEREGRFNIFVRKIDENSCELKVNCLYSQTIQPATGDASTRKSRNCVSTGKLEAEIFELVKSKIDE